MKRGPVSFDTSRFSPLNQNIVLGHFPENLKGIPEKKFFIDTPLYDLLLHWESLGDHAWVSYSRHDIKKDFSIDFQAEPHLDFIQIIFAMIPQWVEGEEDDIIYIEGKRATLVSNLSRYKVFVNSGTSFEALNFHISRAFVDKNVRTGNDHKDLPGLIDELITGKFNTYSRVITQEEERLFVQLTYILQKQGKSSSALEIRKMGYELLHTYFETTLHLNSGSYLHSIPQRLSVVTQYLEEHIFDRFPGLDMLAAKVSMSVSAFKTHFKNTFQCTPVQYFRQKQIALARHALKHKHYNLSQLTELFHFQNSSNLKRSIRRYEKTDLPEE
jgi:AraC-like DNA-binding protein